MAAARAGHVVGGADNALTPIREETESEWAKATPTRRNKSDDRGRLLSSGRIKVMGAASGRLLPGEMRVRRKVPPSSAKRIKSKDPAFVAAVAKKPKRSFNAVSSGEKNTVQDEQLPPTTEVEAEPAIVASAQKTKAKTKLSKSERALKKAKAALKLAEANVEADKISIKKKSKVRDERNRQARERDAATLKVSPPCPPAQRTRAYPRAPAHAHG